MRKAGIELTDEWADGRDIIGCNHPDIGRYFTELTTDCWSLCPELTALVEEHILSCTMCTRIFQLMDCCKSIDSAHYVSQQLVPAE